MTPAPLPPHEGQRLEDLRALQLLDTPPEQAYDDLIHILADICGAPIALVSLIDEHRQWFKARVGLELSHVARDMAFCSYTIQSPAVFVVPDARQDPRFADNPLVTDRPRVRFYAGVPLRPLGSEAVGSLCVIDDHPRQLSERQLDALQALGRQVTALMKARHQLLELRETRQRLQMSERALVLEAATLRGILNSMSESVLVVDRSGRLTFTNSLFAFHHANMPSEATPSEWSATYGYFEPSTEAPFPTDQLPLSRALRGDIVEGQVLLVRRPQQPDMRVAASARPLLIAGEVEGAVAVTRDVTREWDLQQSKDEMLSIASHEIRAPLTSIIGSLGLIQNGMAEPSRHGKLVAMALNNAERMHALLTNLLDVERLKAGKEQLQLSPCNADDFVQQLLESMKGLAEAGQIQLDSVVAEPFSFVGDREKLVRACTNLVSNAIKFSGEGTQVTVGLSCRDGVVRVEVADEGPGIPAEFMPLLFERFQSRQGVSKLPGTGLGLALSRDIVRLHGGDIVAENRHPHGARFILTLPAR